VFQLVLPPVVAPVSGPSQMPEKKIDVTVLTTGDLLFVPQNQLVVSNLSFSKGDTKGCMFYGERVREDHFFRQKNIKNIV
jgi:hypothetical protein